jgi:hypothetical protein
VDGFDEIIGAAKWPNSTKGQEIRKWWVSIGCYEPCESKLCGRQKNIS